jgi:hypothetical protein
MRYQVANALHAFIAPDDVRVSKITDAVLSSIDHLSNLELRCLEAEQMTNAGSEHLKLLRRLVDIELNETPVTPALIRDLQKALPNTSISRSRLQPIALIRRRAALNRAT